MAFHQLPFNCPQCLIRVTLEVIYSSNLKRPPLLYGESLLGQVSVPLSSGLERRPFYHGEARPTKRVVLYIIFMFLLLVLLLFHGESLPRSLDSCLYSL